MKLRNNSIGVAAVALLLAVSVASAQNGREVLVIADKSPNAWPDCQLEDKLQRGLVSEGIIVVAKKDLAEAIKQESSGRFDRMALIRAGSGAKCRYVIWCDVLKQEIKTEKAFSLPFLLSQRRIQGYLELDYTIIDCVERKTVTSDHILLHRSGPSALQAFESTDADPALQMSYPEQKDLFDKLESEAAEILVDHVRVLTSGNNP